MEMRIIYAMITIFLSWMYSFLIKVATERNYNSSLITCYSYTVCTFFAWINILYRWFDISHIYIIWILAFINAITYFLSIVTRMVAMKNIDSVIFFPLYKTFSPILVTLTSVFLFSEHLWLKESLWIIIWISIPLLLVSSKENKIQKNLKKWLIFTIITALIVMITNAAAKQIMVEKLDLHFFIFCTSFIWMMLSFFSYKKISKIRQQDLFSKKILIIWFFLWLFQYLNFVTFQNSLVWNLAIAFTINSFSLLIPIILSIIFYKEHFNLKKAIVIGLSILSILLFI